MGDSEGKGPGITGIRRIGKIAIPLGPRSVGGMLILFLGAYGVALFAGAPVWITSSLFLPFWALAPGYAILSLVSPRALDRPGRTLVLAFALSFPVKVIALFFPVRYLGVSPEAAFAATIIVSAAALFVAMILRGGEGRRVTVRAVFFEVIWAGVLFLPLVGFAFGTINLSAHGFFYGGIVAQVLNGFIPPENPAMAGYPINFYWAFMLYSAVMVEASGLSIAAVRVIESALALIAYAGLVRMLAGLFFSRRTAVYAGFIAAFGINALGIGYMAIRLLTGETMGHFFPTDVWASEMMFPLLPGEPKFHIAYYISFVSPSSFPHGLVSATLAILAAVPGLFQERERLLLAFFGLLGAFLLSPVTGGGALFGISVAVIGITVARSAGIDGLVKALFERPNLALAGACLLAFLFVMPHIWETSSLNYGVGIRPGGIVNFTMLLDAFLLQLPLIAAALLWNRHQGPALYVLVLFFALVVLSWPFDLYWNQLRFLLLAAPAAGILACRGILALRRRFGWRWLKYGIIGLAGLVYADNALVGLFWTVAPSYNHLEAKSDGRSVTAVGWPQQSGALNWVRENTERDAVVVEWGGQLDRAFIGLVGMRRQFVGEAGLDRATGFWHLFAGYEEAPKRKALVRELFAPGGEKVEVVTRITERLDAPFYVLLTEEQSKKDFPALLEDFRGLENLEEIYAAAGAAVFRVRSSPGG